MATRAPLFAEPPPCAAGVSTAFGGLTWAASAVSASEIPASAAMPARRHLTGLLIMIRILSSRNDLDSDIAATAPMYADWRSPTEINVSP